MAIIGGAGGMGDHDVRQAVIKFIEWSILMAIVLQLCFWLLTDVMEYHHESNNNDTEHHSDVCNFCVGDSVGRAR